MDRSIIQNNVDEIIDPSREVIEEIAEIMDQVAPALVVPSYRPTRWTLANKALDKVDTLTSGRAGSLLQFASFLTIGGSTTIVNLAIVYVVLYKLNLPLTALSVAVRVQVANLIASALGSELSLIANYMLNDTFTFRDAPGHDRPWFTRFSRFHATAIVGILLTIGLQSLQINLLHIQPLIGQGIAVIIVLFYNFFFHQFFTYRRLKDADAV